MSRPLPLTFALAAALGFLAACRKADSGSSASSSAIPPSLVGSAGCAGASQTFSPGQLPSEVVLATAAFGPLSQVCAARDAEILYVTGSGGSVYAIDMSGPMPVETELVAAGAIDPLLSAAGIAASAELSGIAVVDATTLYVMEHSSHIVLGVDRSAHDTFEIAYGLPSAQGGKADGLGLFARFSFTHPAMLAATADGRVYLADPGNHALRLLAGGVVTTIAGSGAPFYADGDLQATLFDTPSGVCFDCANHVIVSELGAAGLGGHRVRELTLGPTTFFGQLGTSTTLAGDGTSASSEGVGGTASLAAPVAPVVSEGGELYWIDSASGVLRSQPSVSASVACPLGADCAAAVLAPTFTPGATLSLALTEGGVLYALDAGAAKLWRITP